MCPPRRYRPQGTERSCPCRRDHETEVAFGEVVDVDRSSRVVDPDVERDARLLERGVGLANLLRRDGRGGGLLDGRCGHRLGVRGCGRGRCQRRQGRVSHGFDASPLQGKHPLSPGSVQGTSTWHARDVPQAGDERLRTSIRRGTLRPPAHGRASEACRGGARAGRWRLLLGHYRAVAEGNRPHRPSTARLRRPAEPPAAWAHPRLRFAATRKPSRTACGRP
jgi:hypothetical protein